MLILIAESKTMSLKEMSVKESYLLGNTPRGQQIAQEIMRGLSTLTVPELMAQTGVSASMAAKMSKMIYEFPHRATGLSAIRAFTGVVFKALDYETLSPEARGRCKDEVAVISSLYGWLRPEDIVKPYRLDFFTRLEQGPSAGRALNEFWRPDVTKALVSHLRERDCHEILNLLPADAAKAIDWKLVKRFAKVWKVDFQEVKDGGKTRTPMANRLKHLRGLLLRQILEEGISDAEGLLHSVSPHYICTGTPVYPDHLQFIC